LILGFLHVFKCKLVIRELESFDLSRRRAVTIKFERFLSIHLEVKAFIGNKLSLLFVFIMPTPYNSRAEF
jgi:hypothetical protein